MGIFGKKLAYAGVALFIGTLLVLALPIQSNQSYGLDYLHFWGMERAAVEAKVESIYDPACHPAMLNVLNLNEDERLQSLLAEHHLIYKTGLHPTGTPFLYAALGTLQTGNFSRDLWLFQIASNSLLVFGLGLFVFRLFSIDRLSRQVQMAIFLGLLLPICLPLMIDMRVGNVSRIQVGAVGIAFAFWFTESTGSAAVRINNLRVFASGVTLGLIVALKPNTIVGPGMMLLLLMMRGQLRTAMAFAGGIALGFLSAICFARYALSDQATWMDWRSYLSTTLDAPFRISDGNYSLVSLLPPALFQWLSPLAIIVFAIGLTLFWFLTTVSTHPGVQQPVSPKQRGESAADHDSRFPRSEVDVVALGACGLAIPLLFAPIAWTHYFALAIPLLLMTFKMLLGTERTKLFLGVAAILLMGLPMVYIPANFGESVAVLFAFSVLLLFFESARSRSRRKMLQQSIQAE